MRSPFSLGLAFLCMMILAPAQAQEELSPFDDIWPIEIVDSLDIDPGDLFDETELLTNPFGGELPGYADLPLQPDPSIRWADTSWVGSVGGTEESWNIVIRIEAASGNILSANQSVEIVGRQLYCESYDGDPGLVEVLPDGFSMSAFTAGCWRNSSGEMQDDLGGVSYARTLCRYSNRATTEAVCQRSNAARNIYTFKLRQTR